MEVFEITAENYSGITGNSCHRYATAEFNLLNRGKCDEVVFLLFSDGSPRYLLSGGITGNSFLSPFSSPFCGFVNADGKARISDLDDTLALFEQWARGRNLDSLFITLPPPVYGEDLVAKQVSALFRKGFRIKNIELNYHYNADSFSEDYPEKIWRNARKNLNISLKVGLSFKKCDTEIEKIKVYDVIKQNREAKGKPLRMSYIQVTDTTRIIESDFFLVKNPGGEGIASAIVFHVAPSVVQVIYWGDIQGVANLKAMNFLSYNIFGYYSKQNIRIIDVGPSTENSIPNYGLCEFKESIGCYTTSKFSLFKTF